MIEASNREGNAMYTDAQKTFLAEHMWAVLATGRRDGTPQQSMVGYALDDVGRLLISTRSPTAKWQNITRNPQVCLTVPGGRLHVVVYGTAEAITADPERAERTADVLAVVRGPERPDPASIAGWIENEARVVLRVTPDKVLLHE